MTVSGIAWRLTAKQGAETSLRHMLGFSSFRATSPALQSFRRAASGATGGGGPFSAYVIRNSFGRSCPGGGGGGGGYYYEFQFRPPPPSYHASMTDYRLVPFRSTNGLPLPVGWQLHTVLTKMLLAP